MNNLSELASDRSLRDATAGSDQGQSQQEFIEVSVEKPTQEAQRPVRRVCNTCRRRKVGCDKKQPCHNCERTNTECVYPTIQKPTSLPPEDSELWSEVRNLVPILKTLVNQMHDTGSSGFEALSRNATETVMEPLTRQSPATGSRPSNTYGNSPSWQDHGDNQDATPLAHEANMNMTSTMIPIPASSGSEIAASLDQSRRLNDQLALQTDGDSSLFDSESPSSSIASSWSPYGAGAGRLVRDLGRHKYIRGRFWEFLHNASETEDEDDSSDESEEEEEDGSYSCPPETSTAHALLFNSLTPAQVIRPFHLPESQHLQAWQLYKQNVHPMTPILHIPTIEPTILAVARNARGLIPPIEALAMVMHFAAVSSLRELDVLQVFGSPRSQLMPALRNAAELALSRANILDTGDLMTLQAFIIFIFVLRSTDPTKSWTLSGLAIRILQSAGMHRDGDHLELDLFEAEMRRRLWWGLSSLDVPASEDHSCSSTILEIGNSDTRIPLNVDDAQLYPEMTTYPAEFRGFTDMSLLVARSMSTDIWRTMYDTRRVDPLTGRNFASMTLDEKEKWVDKQYQNIKRKIFGAGETSLSLYWYCHHYVEAIAQNLRLFVYDDIESEEVVSESQSQDTFTAAITCMAHTQMMRTDPRYSNWSWFTNTFNEWYSFAVIIKQLHDKPVGRGTDKAWRVVEQFTLSRWESSHSRGVHQWRSVMKSVEKVRKRRKQVRRMKMSRSGESSSRTGYPRDPAFRRQPRGRPSPGNRISTGYSMSYDMQASMDLDGQLVHENDFMGGPMDISTSATMPLDLGQLNYTMDGALLGSQTNEQM